MKLRHRHCSISHLLSTAIAGCAFLSLAGCGSGFTFPSSSSFTIYPGQTVVVPVAVPASSGTTGTVTLTVASLPSGVTVAPVTATAGSTANLTFVSTPALAKELFTGVNAVWTADSTIKVLATSSSGTTTLQSMDMGIVLTNPDFTPTTTNLPVIDIETTGAVAVDSKDNYVAGTMTITDASDSSNNYSDTVTIKGHGNSTWFMPKKPYHLKLDSKSALLGMKSEKNWVLLANYDDKTMLRDAVASEVSIIAGMAWSPNSKFVELTLNGAYMGTYQLIENVDINSKRVDIADSDASYDPTADGFLMEQDDHEEDTYHWITPYGVDVGANDPDPPLAAGAIYIHSLVDTSEASFFATNASDPSAGWRKYWDQDSLVEWFLVNEFMGNQDADGTSMYFYKDAGTVPFYAGPVWDFDISSGNDNTGSILSPTVPWVSTKNIWYAQLLKDPTFLAAVKARWTTMEPQIATTIPSYITTQAASLSVAAENNYSRWPTLYQRVWPNAEAAGSYQGEVTYMQQWLAARLQYMNGLYLEN